MHARARAGVGRKVVGAGPSVGECSASDGHARGSRGPAPRRRTSGTRWYCGLVLGERGSGLTLLHKMRSHAPPSCEAICFRIPLS